MCFYSAKDICCCVGNIPGVSPELAQLQSVLVWVQMCLTWANLMFMFMHNVSASLGVDLCICLLFFSHIQKGIFWNSFQGGLLLQSTSQGREVSSAAVSCFPHRVSGSVTSLCRGNACQQADVHLRSSDERCMQSLHDASIFQFPNELLPW